MLDKRLDWKEQDKEGSKCINNKCKDQARSLTILETQWHP
jgi:hypothetical protein